MEKDKKIDIQQQDVAKSTPAASGAVVEKPAIDPNCNLKQRTFGNKVFDWVVYSSVSWAGVSIASLVTVYQARFGTAKAFNWLRTMDKKFASILKEGVFSKIFSNPEKAESWAAGTALYWMLGFGGTALSPILKYMEDNRLKLSGKIDEIFGTTPPDPDLIAKEPKQSWLSVLSGRFASVALGFTTFCALGPKGADAISKWFGERATKLYTRFSPKSNPIQVRRVADIAVFDVMFTVATAAFTYAISRIVAKRTDDIPDDDDCLPPLKTATNVVSDTPSEQTKKFAVEIDKKPLRYTEQVTALPSASQSLQAAV